MEKQRHGIITAWLILGIVVNFFSIPMHLFNPEILGRKFMAELPLTYMYLLAALAMVNIICFILLFKWKKIGFTIAVFSAIATFLVKIYGGHSLFEALPRLLFGIGALAGILQIRKDGISAWQNLD